MAKPKATDTPAETRSPNIQAGSPASPSQRATTQPSAAETFDETTAFRDPNASEASEAEAAGVVTRRVVRRSARTGTVSRSAVAAAVKAVKKARESQINP